MRFTRLRLNGFKSFVDPTDMIIADGLTGVVGPNGCGKSNLLEALRWVMGENRPSAMRGGPMFEFLFGIDTMLRQQGRRDKFRLVFFNGSDRPGQRLGPKAVDGLLREMWKRDISVHIGAKPLRIEADKVVTEREEIPADLVLYLECCGWQGGT